MAIDGMRTRFVTSVFFVVIMLAGILIGKYSFTLLFGLIALLCLREFLGAGLETNGSSKKWLNVLGILFGLTPFLALMGIQMEFWSSAALMQAAVLFPILLFAVFLLELFRTSEAPFAAIGQIFTALVYIGIPFALLGIIAFDDSGAYRKFLILGLVILTWTNDTWAYILGSRFGKTPLYPKASPKKTWEGTLGGGLCSVIMAIILSQFIPDIRMADWIVLALLVFVFGTLGDLVESMFKRSRQIKDSGNLLPGHGGLLDRFDGFIFHLPFTAAYVILWML